MPEEVEKFINRQTEADPYACYPPTKKKRKKEEALPERGHGLEIGTARKGKERGKGTRLTKKEREKRHKKEVG